MGDDEPVQPPADGGFGWIIVLASFVVSFLVDGVLFTFGVLLVGLVEELDESTLSVAILGGVFVGVVAIAAPCAGSLSDTFGRRVIVVTGAALFSVGLFVSSFATNIGLLYFTYGVLGGCGYGLMLIPSVAAVMEHFHNRRGTASGIALCGSGLGIVVMSFATNHLLETLGMRGTFLLLSGMMLHGIPCGLLLRPPRPITDPMHIKLQIIDLEKSKQEGTDPENSKQQITIPKHSKQQVTDPENNKQLQTEPVDDARKKTLKDKLKHVKNMFTHNIEVFRDFKCLCFLLSAFIFGLGHFVPISFLPKEAVAMGMGKDKAAWLSSTIGITNTVSRLAVGWLGHRSFMNRTLLLKGIIFLMAVSFLTSLLLTTFHAKLVFAAVYGALLGSYVVTVPLALADEVPAEKFGKTTGLFISMLAGATLIGTPIAGWTIDVTGGFNVCYIMAGSEALLGLVILFFPMIRNGCTYKN